jgi:sugar transferase EpsL
MRTGKGVMSRRSAALKRTVDVVGATIGLAIAAPAMAGIAVLVRWRMGRPVLFRQERPGLHGKPFVILKFRTMAVTHDPTGRPLPDQARLTRLGSFLRRSSLDELPELINVLKGEMSLVGPRPLLMQYLELYTPEQARRHEVRPGLTGWAQVNGRNAISWEAKFALDVWYVDHWSLRLDMKILLLTLLKSLTGEGVSQPGHATVEYFDGTAGS